ncbi:type IV pilus modification PilV family protein [Sulfuritalea hydrogenivorans]|uniref:type IV pilus modification PilV family protein n=1 Tax=Sulfuritalea hydrogenivorans TaxID=748811 RepID=UPI001E541C7A
MFIVIVSVGLAGILMSLNVSVRSSADPLQPKQALAIAEAMLEEVLLKPYVPVSGYVASCPTTCDRPQFDDIDDYANYGPVTATSIDGLITLAGYTVQVRVPVATVAIGTVPMKQITVTVVPPSGAGHAISLTGYRADY